MHHIGFGALQAVTVLAVALLGIALGWVIVRYGGFGADLGSAAVVTVGAIACVGVIVAGPVACLAAVAALTASGLDQSIAEVGSLSIRVSDVFWVGVAGWWLLRLIDRSVHGVEDPRPVVAFGQLPAIAFFGYAGLALLSHGLSDSSAFSTGLVPWLRVVDTALLAFLAAAMIETKRDVRLVLGALALGAVVAVALAAVSGGDLLSARRGGEVGKNQLGLLSGLLLLGAFFGRWRPAVRYPVGAIATLGLVLAKSVASFVSAGVAVAVGMSIAGGARAGSGVQRWTRGGLALVIAAAIAFTAVQVFRPEQLPSSEEFRGGSAEQRIVVGATGLEIFKDNPVTGVGWGQSSSPDIIADRDVVLNVRRRFSEASPRVFPDVTPTTVHNMYIQILAELGLIGLLLFLAIVVAVAVRAVELLRRLGPDHELYPEALVLSLGLLLALIWHNEAPLYGGQPETMIPILMLGTLVAIARIARAR